MLASLCDPPQRCPFQCRDIRVHHSMLRTRGLKQSLVYERRRLSVASHRHPKQCSGLCRTSVTCPRAYRDGPRACGAGPTAGARGGACVHGQVPPTICKHSPP